MKNKLMITAIAAILIVSTTIFASMQVSKDQVFGQQVPTQNGTSTEKTISVTGTATSSVLPDLVTVQFGVDTEAMTAQQAITANSDLMNSVVAALVKSGVTKDEISTAGFSIYPIYNNTIPDPRTGIQQSVLAGYRTSNTLYVKTGNLSSAGQIIDTAVGAGANRVDSVSFSLSPDKQQSMQDDLIGKAVLNAKSRAGLALEPLGQKIIGVKSVSLSDFSIPPLPMSYMARADIAPSTQIFTANQDVTTTVSVIFLISAQ